MTAPEGKPTPFKGIGNPGCRSDGSRCAFQIVVDGARVLAGYETRHAAEQDIALYQSNPAMKTWKMSIRENAVKAAANAKRLPRSPRG